MSNPAIMPLDALRKPAERFYLRKGKITFEAGAAFLGHSGGFFKRQYMPAITVRYCEGETMTKNDWKRAARKGGPGWELAGLLFMVVILLELIRSCSGR